jgi:ATP-dependent Zn protease
MQVGREDEFSINRQQMLARILVAMGGTVAEEVVFGRDQVRHCVMQQQRQRQQPMRTASLPHPLSTQLHCPTH